MQHTALLALLALTLPPVFAQTAAQPARAVSDPGVVTTRQSITPAGVASIFQGRVYGLAWLAAGDRIAVLHASDVYVLDWRNNQVLTRLPHAGTPGNQALAAIGSTVYFGNSRRAQGPRPTAQLFALDTAAASPATRAVATSLGSYNPGAFAATSDGRLALVPLAWENKAALVDLASGKVQTSLDTGIAPWGAAIDAAGRTAWISNLGGRPPKPGEPALAPQQKPEEMIPVDARGIASTGTITRFDLASGKPTAQLAAGLHPGALLLDEPRARLYVANGNSDTVSVFHASTNALLRTITLQPFQSPVRGIAPTALALSPDGQRLYVACGGINAVAVVDPNSGNLIGLIPTAWYPNHLALSPDGRHLAVTSLLGAGSGWRDAPSKRFVHTNRGALHVLPLPDAAQLASYTTAVAENNRLRLASVAPAPISRSLSKPTAIPVRSGDPSLIQHVVYIIKENRTYDQVLGDLSQGNGDPSLVMFGRRVTPNQHRLAEQFSLLDNFYATGGNSGDGHQWATQANETAYCLWPGYQGRSYPFDGTDPMAYSSGGFLWDYALARGKSVRVYGEYAGRLTDAQAGHRMKLLDEWKQGVDFSTRWSIRAPLEPLNRILAAQYPSYTNTIPDVVRASIFLKDLATWQQSGTMPNLVILQLPSDHTFGIRAGVSSPSAMVADNDLAVGQIVEGLSKSRFWPKLAVFIVEDDAQNGVDHVDGHRTTAFVASPYVRRGHIDSTFYSHQSILKTIELILGLPTMSIFDLIANDMRASFTDSPDLTPFTAERPGQDLFELTPPLKALRGAPRQAAEASARMDWSVPDNIPTERLNRFLWGAIKGWNTPYPAPRNAVFSPMALDDKDNDKDGDRPRR